MSRREGGQGDDVFDKSLEETESGDYDYLEKILGALFGQFFGYFWAKHVRANNLVHTCGWMNQIMFHKKKTCLIFPCITFFS